MNSEAQVSVHLKNGLEKRNLIIIEKSSYPFPQAKKKQEKENTTYLLCSFERIFDRRHFARSRSHRPGPRGRLMSLSQA